MFSITHPDYFLPTIEPLNAGPVLSSGRTRPMIISGVCRESGKKGDFVVKLKGSPELWEGSNLFETLAAFLAAELGLQVPEPANIDLLPEFTRFMDPGHPNFNLALASIGYNFGCSQFEQYQQMVVNQRIPKSLQKQLAEMFAFDIFISNTDRRKAKPNFLSNGRSLMLFDHEQAFSFALALPFARNPEPWTIRPEDIDWIKNHFCYDLFKGKNIDFSNFTDRLDVINDAFWKRAEELIPVSWMNNYFFLVKQYLAQITSHRDEFAKALNRILL